MNISKSIIPVPGAGTDFEQAVIDVMGAVECRGLKIILVNDPLDIDAVRDRLSWHANCFDPSNVFIPPPGVSAQQAEIVAAQNTILLAKLLIEHLKVRNV